MDSTERIAPSGITVMSFNMAHGCGMDGKVDLVRIAEVIRGSGADIIGLQEVDRHFSSRSSFLDQTALLAEQLGMEYSYGANLVERSEEGPDREYGNAVLSRFPIKFAVNHLYDNEGIDIDDPEPRGVLETTIDLGSTYLSVFNTHMPLGESVLRENMRQLRQIAGSTAFPSVIMGDFNMQPDHPEIISLCAEYRDSFAELEMDDAGSFPSVPSNVNLRPIRIDYIFTDASMIAQQAAVLKTESSDHLPIVAAFAIGLTESEETAASLAVY